MFKKRQKRNFYNVSKTYKNVYLNQQPNKIIEETKNMLNNKQPIKTKLQPIIKQQYQKPKTQTEWSNFHKMNENGIKNDTFFVREK